MENTIKYLSSSPAGDLISFLAGVKQMYQDTGKKGIFYQRLGMPGVSYSDSIHPFSNEEGEAICMNEYMFFNLQPLLKSQEYIEDYLIHNGEQVDFDFNLIRFERQTMQPRFSLNRWYFQVFPQMTTNLSKEWISVNTENPNIYSRKVLINFTQRHRHHIINYHFLKEYEDSIIFIGLKKERDIFCTQWNLNIPLLQVSDFLELAKILKGCKFFLGNQSFCFQLAESLKIPRILELFPMMPNVITIGEDAYDYIGQSQVEFHFRKLINKQ